jgi:hypothetical protein
MLPEQRGRCGRRHCALRLFREIIASIFAGAAQRGSLPRLRGRELQVAQLFFTCPKGDNAGRSISSPAEKRTFGRASALVSGIDHFFGEIAAAAPCAALRDRGSSRPRDLPVLGSADFHAEIVRSQHHCMGALTCGPRSDVAGGTPATQPSTVPARFGTAPVGRT